MKDEAFKEWWYSEGSQASYTHHDCEEHTMRMYEIAWANGAYKEREEANARAQPEQEPVAWQWLDTAHFRKKLPKDAGDGVWNPLYAAPQRPWVGLTDEEHNKLAVDWGCLSADWILYAAAVERAVKEKNT